MDLQGFIPRGVAIIIAVGARAAAITALANLSGEHVQDTELMLAGSVVTVLPVLAVFIVLQRFYVAGILAGSTKG